VDGVDYHFMSVPDFEKLVSENGLLEWARVHRSNYYGTPAAPVREALAAGRVAILEIDLQGARQVRKLLPEAVQIFIAPPSWDELVRRLQGRGAETPEQMERRLATARKELAARSEFDHVVVNDTVDRACEELVKLMGL
jgi:guanylate kinase